MSQFQNIGDEEEKEKEPKEEEKEKEKLGSLHFSLGKFGVLPYSLSFYNLDCIVYTDVHIVLPA